MRLVIGNRLLGEEGYLPFESLDDDLLCSIDKDFDVVKVYRSGKKLGAFMTCLCAIALN